MLEEADLDTIMALCEGPGREVESLDIPETRPGTIIRTITGSQNIYLFEVTDPANCLAHVMRCATRSNVPEAGYRGERLVQSRFEIGSPIFHLPEGGDWSRTSQVFEITIVED